MASASTPNRSERSATTEARSSYKHLSVLRESLCAASSTAGLSRACRRWQTPGVRRARGCWHRLHHGTRCRPHQPLVHALARRGHGHHQRRVRPQRFSLLPCLIASFGWRHALDVFGLIILLGVGSLGALLYRRHPADVGAVPYGMQLPARKPQGHPQPTATRPRELTLAAALRVYQLWAVFGRSCRARVRREGIGALFANSVCRAASQIAIAAGCLSFLSTEIA